MPNYYTLKVKEVTRETADAVTLHFKQPLFKKVKYKPGQFLTLEVDIEGKKVSRSYSMSSAPNLDSAVSVTVKEVPGGKVSPFINKEVKAGDAIRVMEPMGHFVLEPQKEVARHVVLFGAGSGITPLMSILKSILFFEPQSKVSLVYGNRNEEAVIFGEKLEELREQFKERFNIVYVYSQPEKQWNGHKGRIDSVMTQNILNLLPNEGNDTLYYMCGPDGMMEAVQDGLQKAKVSKDKIFKESFTAANESEEALAALGEMKEREVSIKLDGETHKVVVPAGKTILDAALDDGLDMPFSCQSGLCTACRGKCQSGKVDMSEGEGLSGDEIKEGYILTCVGHPMTDDVAIEIE